MVIVFSIENLYFFRLTNILSELQEQIIQIFSIYVYVYPVIPKYSLTELLAWLKTLSLVSVYLATLEKFLSVKIQSEILTTGIL